MLDNIYIIQDKTTGKWYRPRKFSYGEKVEKYWHDDVRAAKVYTKIGYARSACKTILSIQAQCARSGHYHNKPTDMDNIVLDLRIVEFQVVPTGNEFPSEKEKP